MPVNSIIDISHHNVVVDLSTAQQDGIAAVFTFNVANTDSVVGQEFTVTLDQ
jgi:hypothetical protein